MLGVTLVFFGVLVWLQWHRQRLALRRRVLVGSGFGLLTAALLGLACWGWWPAEAGQPPQAATVPWAGVPVRAGRMPTLRPPPKPFSMA